MNRPTLSAYIATLTFALLVIAGALGAQGVDPAKVKAYADSISRETCRGGTLSTSGLTCTGATRDPRATWLRRFANGLRALPVTGTPAPSTHTGYAVQLAYHSATMYQPAPGVDTVTVCAVVTDQAGRRRLVWPPVRMQVLGDSARVTTRYGNPLSSMCARAISAFGLTSTDSLPVTWGGDWITVGGVRLWRPFPSVP